MFVYCNFLVLLSTTVCSQNVNKQNVNIADETLTDYSFLSRYHYTKSKNYLKRRYRIRHWILMFIGTPCILWQNWIWRIVIILVSYTWWGGETPASFPNFSAESLMDSTSILAKADVKCRLSWAQFFWNVIKITNMVPHETWNSLKCIFPYLSCLIPKRILRNKIWQAFYSKINFKVKYNWVKEQNKLQKVFFYTVYGRLHSPTIYQHRRTREIYMYVWYIDTTFYISKFKNF